MIDSYMDRCDAKAQTWNVVHNGNKQIYDDPRYWNGRIFATVLDRRVAEAKRNLSIGLAMDWLDHRHEMESGIKAGDSRSQFWPTGQRK